MLSPLSFLPGAGARICSDAGAQAAGDADERVLLAPSPRAVVYAEGTARLLHFERPAAAPAAPGCPVLLVPSLINRWYVLDLRAGASLVERLTGDGHDVYCLDWGAPEDEDRYLGWDAVLSRLRRAVRRVLRDSGAPRLGLLGYCMGGTLSAIYAARHPEQIAALVNLAGPIDFSEAGALATMVDPRWFDADAIADAGNVHPQQMQAGFVALRPTLQIAKVVGLADRAGDAAGRRAFAALEAWSSDNIPFPAAAYRTYISEIYQQNALVRGTHRALGRPVSLGAIRAPVLCIVAERDTICPPTAARALVDRCGSDDTEVLSVPGGHVGAVVGRRAARDLYPATSAWMRARLGRDRIRSTPPVASQDPPTA